ncbi:MAG: hypothetical protein AMJ55_09425 [Gammaproteobacteria bacterium SG8_15]|nr:MAG: hypothetical protein AMJ55_09425 [Gammaproteobacteria bacterium SG8_15]
MWQNKHVMALVFIGVCTFAANTAVGDVKESINPQITPQIETAQQKLPEAQKERSRGQLLYENHCGGCHETSVHGRDPRKAASISEIRHWINVWQKELKLDWSEAEIDDVTSYINFKYYKFAE